MPGLELNARPCTFLTCVGVCWGELGTTKKNLPTLHLPDNRESELLIDNLLVRIHFITEMMHRGILNSPSLAALHLPSRTGTRVARASVVRRREEVPHFPRARAVAQAAPRRRCRHAQLAPGSEFRLQGSGSGQPRKSNNPPALTEGPIHNSRPFPESQFFGTKALDQLLPAPRIRGAGKVNL